jgi:7,8-dihydropterin-6-yl-methyl-4-(beta-D-ribofuranosyl)aminobenzene 5'-phosphate synthase
MKDLEPIDQIEFQVLVDNVTGSLSTGPKNVTLEWPALMRAGMREMAGSCQCCANHGLSLVITARRDGAQHTISAQTLE